MHPADNSVFANQVEVEMPRYQAHKKVWALKIADVAGTKLTFAEPGYAPISVDPAMFIRYTPVPGDYYVVYDDGYKSISPAKAFSEGYTRIPSIRDVAAQEYKREATDRAHLDASEECKTKIQGGTR